MSSSGYRFHVGAALLGLFSGIPAVVSVLFSLLFLSSPIWPGCQDAWAMEIDLFGKVTNPHGQPVHGAVVRFLPAGCARTPEDVLSEAETGEDGSYMVRLSVRGLFPETRERGASGLDGACGIELWVEKPSYATVRQVVLSPREVAAMAVAGAPGDVRKIKRPAVRADVTMERKAGPAFWVASVIFVLVYVLISFELIHRTLAAMLGAASMLAVSYTLGTFMPQWRILTYDRAISAIDMNVIFLLMGMMIIVGILKHTGVFQWCAYQCYRIARGKVMALAVILMTFTAVTSALLDNVTTMLLLTPVTIEIATSLGISPLALLMPEIIASNVGGTATLIGDPPNILIGSFAGLSFPDFVVNLTPVCAASLFALFFYTRFAYKGEFRKARVDDIDGFIEELRLKYRITDAGLLTVGGIVMAMVVAMFLCHGMLHMEVSIAALFGAALLFTHGLVTGKVELVSLVEKDIEWPTLLFFIFLFILVGAVEEVGLLDLIADWILRLSHDSLVPAIFLILWSSAIVSAFVDNIPFTATMLPIVAYLTSVIPGAESGVLWWSLAFGVCFGGNGTMIGASANVVTLGIAERAGYHIGFMGFMRVAFPYMVISVAMANLWLLLCY